MDAGGETGPIPARGVAGAVSAETERRVELTKAIYTARARDEVDEVMESAHPDVVADWSRSRGPTRVYRGLEAVRDFFAGVEFRDGLLARVILYQGEEEALAAVRDSARS